MHSPYPFENIVGRGRMPNELVYMVFKYLTPIELAKAAGVCITWKTYINRNKFFSEAIHKEKSYYLTISEILNHDKTLIEISSSLVTFLNSKSLSPKKKIDTLVSFFDAIRETKPFEMSDEQKDLADVNQWYNNVVEELKSNNYNPEKLYNAPLTTLQGLQKLLAFYIGMVKKSSQKPSEIALTLEETDEDIDSHLELIPRHDNTLLNNHRIPLDRVVTSNCTKLQRILRFTGLSGVVPTLVGSILKQGGYGNDGINYTLIGLGSLLLLSWLASVISLGVQVQTQLEEISNSEVAEDQQGNEDNRGYQSEARLN